MTQVRGIEDSLAEHHELFDKEKLDEFKRITILLEKNIQIARQQSRTLRIGIVGAMKAGKSSFLNACIFDGKEFLPKAATPMTAALTKITYSETPRALIHFYTQEDWAKVVETSGEYDTQLDKEYGEYCRRYQEQMQLQGIYAPPNMSLSEYERRLFRPSEVQRGAKELTRMVTDPSITEKLGCTDTLEGDVMGKLNDYVGANGAYTPIVSYVELQSDSPYVKDLEIVDTPGLNDPIVSRGIVTKQFLRACDVVLLLSPCSQFMDAKTINLMAGSLPSAGVREVIVIGSKLDSGILNESCNDFQTAYKNALNSYKLQFQRSIEQVRSDGRYSDIVGKFGQGPGSLLFVSSTCFSIARKRGTGEPLDENEQKVLENLKRYSDFEERFLPSLGGIRKVKESLNEVLKRKTEIIDEKNGSLLDDARRDHLRILEAILKEVVSSRTKLETASVEDLEQKVRTIQDVIDTSREKLTHIFDSTAIGCDRKIQQIRLQLTVELNNHQDVKVETSHEDKQKTVRTGLFGLRKEVIHYTVTERGVDTSCVTSNIKQYAAQCQTYVNQEFQYIFNSEQLAQRVKEVLLTAFQKSGQEFEPDDILLPLQNILNRISIPRMELDYTPYIDELETNFRDGCAKNEDIHRLMSLQTRLLDRIEKELGGKLENALTKISEALSDQAVHFADDIEGKLSGELKKLGSQTAEREKYIAEYLEFAQSVRELKAEVSGL